MLLGFTEACGQEKLLKTYSSGTSHCMQWSEALPRPVLVVLVGDAVAIAIQVPRGVLREGVFGVGVAVVVVVLVRVIADAVAVRVDLLLRVQGERILGIRHTSGHEKTVQSPSRAYFRAGLGVKPLRAGEAQRGPAKDRRGWGDPARAGQGRAPRGPKKPRASEG